MESVKKNIFWIGIGVLVLASLGFWGAAVFAKQGQVTVKKNEYDARVASLEKYADKPEELKNRSDIDVLGNYIGGLQKMEKRITESLQGRKDTGSDGRPVYTGGMNIKTNVERFDEKPIVADVARFRQWADQMYGSL
ncbi:MAG TPA: hypothetical protein ENN09_02515, partial [Planctomycetes bacterium]|nr:hypothetical protein [Planctomycetota bacterium]